MKFTTLAVLILSLLLITACGKKSENAIQKQIFGHTPNGAEVVVYTLENKLGMQVSLMNYGAAIVSIKTADNKGHIKEITLGFDSLKQYLEQSPYFGATVGRYANRIAHGKFTLLDQDYQLATNNGPNHLHGGNRGFDKVVWQAQTSTTDSGQTVTFHYTSPDGEEGYPGQVDVSVSYTLSKNNTLTLRYSATTTKPTIINLANHTYFNLKDAGKTDILGHVLKINADNYTPVDATLIPTGEIAPVAGTPFDFRQPHTIGERIDADDQQLANAGGYDHNFVLGNDTEAMRLAATVFEPTTGRVMNIVTTQPGVQFYSGNFLDGLEGRGGAVYNKHAAFCLETQHFPDSPNHKNFPSVVLNPGEKYKATTFYKFSLQFVGLDR